MKPISHLIELGCHQSSQLNHYFYFPFVFIFLTTVLSAQSSLISTFKSPLNSFNQDLIADKKNLLDKTNPEDYDKSKTSVETLPALTNAFEAGKVRVLPDVDIIGNSSRSKNYTASKKDLEHYRNSLHQIRLFTTNVSFDTTRAVNGFNYLVKDASKVGVSYSGLFSRKKPSKYGTNIWALATNFSLLTKEMPDSSEDANGATGILTYYASLGTAFDIANNFVAGHLTYNWVGTLFNTNAFENYYGNDNHKAGFLELGLTLVLDLNNPTLNQGEDKLMLEIVAIFNDFFASEHLDQYVNSNNGIITPRVKLAYRKTFVQK